MSLLSRWFRKAPSQSPAPSSAASTGPHENAEPALQKRAAADRALAAAAEEKVLQVALDSRDVQTVARLVVAGASTRVRQTAAQAIDDPELLRQLLREVRGGSDKNVYKILAAKRDALSTQNREREQLRAEIEAAAGAIERHSQDVYELAYAARLVQLETRWNAVAAQADPELRGKVEQWIGRCQETITGHQRELAAQAARAEAAAAAAAEAQRQREQEAEASAAAAAEQAGLAAEQQRLRAEQQDAERQAVHQIGELIRKARAALGDGSSTRAAGMRRSIEEKLAALPALPAGLASQLQQLDRQLDELQDWKRFSVAPKRTGLIERMESLIGADLHPQALADQIRKLQEQWRALGKGVSPGAGDDPEADWQRFNEAAQKAYQPCSEFFAAQALVRAENLQRREALLASLVAFEAGQDWQNPDWQAVIRAQRDAKQEWRGCSPVDPQAARPQQERFSALVASLQDRLDAEYARNRQQKESLIERAQALLASEDGRKAIDGVKTLQQQWRLVGPLPREVDQALWAQFRQHCDAVFQKRDQDAAAHAAGLQDNRAQALALCEQVEQIAALEAADLLARAATLGELRAAFEALGELPRADVRELRRRFDQGLERCKAAVARQHAREAEGAWHDLFEVTDSVRAYRLAVARGLDAEQLAALKQAAETSMAAVPRWPRGGLDNLQQALAEPPSADLGANEAALRLLCIRAEMLADLPTPPEDQPLRREHQLQRLVQGMGQRLAADVSQDALAIEWLRVGPVGEQAYQPLLQRFRRCREQGRARG